MNVEQQRGANVAAWQFLEQHTGLLHSQQAAPLLSLPPSIECALHCMTGSTSHETCLANNPCMCACRCYAEQSHQEP